AVWQHVKAGKVKAIAVTSTKRSLTAPDVPTIAEPGVADVVVFSGCGLFSQGKNPPAVIARLNGAMLKVLENPQIKEKLFAQGAEAAPSTPAEFDRVIKEELAKWEYVIRAANIKPE